MKIIGTTFEKLPRERLVIGFEGENLRATVRIDCASVFAEYPNATPTLIVKPLFADAYPVVVDRNGTDVDWLITSEILSFNGDGEIQLVFYKNEVICKSAVSKIRVCRSLQVTGEMPDPVVQWIENANRKLAEVDAQIVELEGMVDTATDAATRAEQSASTASAKAEQAAGSAATATEKATEATNAAGTATAKAAEAALSATQANNSAMSAADSERGATAKAAEAAQSAQTAAQKAEQITEAAQIATGKAGEASASATAAQESATDAAASATAASASETAAKASETAAGASATQAAQSAQGASADAQTAMQKAAEATQSATDAETFAGTATTKAEEAAASAQAAQDAKTAVEETAEQLADSLEQIEQNTQDIAELDERKANIDGYYPDMTVGNAEQLNSSKYVENSEPYIFRQSGGSSDIGNREYLDAVVGGTVAWNQMVRDEASENSTDFADIVTVTDAVEDAAGVKVKIEPVQDLHGYENPWPAGGGKNLLPYATIESPLTKQGITFVRNQDGSIAVNGTSTVSFSQTFVEFALEPGNYYFNCGNDFSLQPSTYVYIRDVDNSRTLAEINSSSIGVDKPFSIDVQTNVRFYMVFGTTGLVISGTLYPMIRLASETDATFAPYENICPITGWDGVKVTRTGKNLFDTQLFYNNAVARGYTANRISYSDGVLTLSQMAYGERYTYYEPSCGYSENTRYTIKLRVKTIANDSGNGSFMIRFVYSNNLTQSKSVTLGTVGNEKAIVLTSDAGKTVSRVTFGDWGYFGTVEITDIQLESSSAATDYEPYAGNTYDITLPTEAGTVYGGELTVNADGSGSLVVDRASVDLGTLNWSYFNIAGHYRFVAYPQGIKSFDSNTLANILCSEYAVDTANNVFNNATDKRISSGGGALLVYDSDYSSVDDFKTAMSGVQLVYPLATPITYTLTAPQITTLLGQNNIWADTGDLALTYTGTDEHLVLESGKKYLARISGTDSMLLGSGQEITAAKGADNVFDLTQMFGTAVADYVYGQGAGFFRKWFGKQWYSYNTGELKHVEGLQSHDMVGFNQWDEEWEVGIISWSGVNTSSSDPKIRSKGYIPVLPNTTYTVTTTANLQLFYYDSEKVFLSYAPSSLANKLNFTTPANCCYVRFYTYNTYGNTYKHDICISLAHNNSRNGEYAPYEKHSYPLDSTVILRGIPKVGANGVYWDGDRYLPDGTVERRYAHLVFDGTEAWILQSVNQHGIANFYLTVTPYKTGSIPKGICNIFAQQTTNIADTTTEGWLLSAGSYLYVRISADKASTSSQFKTWLANNNLQFDYELATPTTETAQPYHSTQWVSDWGTEEFVSTGIVPVGSETRYPANLRDKLQHLPDAASGNGSYLITQTDGQMVLTPFPAPPSTAGNYVLKATVVNGVATYTWEAAT